MRLSNNVTLSRRRENRGAQEPETDISKGCPEGKCPTSQQNRDKGRKERGRICSQPSTLPQKGQVKPRLVFVEWVDTFGCSTRWEDISESMTVKPLTCMSVGWLIYDGSDCKVVVPHMTDPDHQGTLSQGCGDMTIPTQAIVAIRPLKVC
jgi:hypothetical protein